MPLADILKPEIFEGLKLGDFIALDIETTGLEYLREDIIEFAAVHFRNGEPIDNIDFYIKPTKSIPHYITRITGISDKDVKDAPPFAKVLPRILDFVKDYPVVAHNVSFDLPFLEYHARKAKGDFSEWNHKERQFRYYPNQQIDTIILSRMYVPFVSSFNLSSLAEYFQISAEQAHRALPDAQMAGRLLLELLNIALKTKFADVQKILQILEPTDDPIKTFFENLALFLSTGKFNIPEGIDREQFSISANYYNIIGQDATPDEFDSEINPIDEEEIRAFFDAGGELAQEFGLFEVRHPQVRMARAIAKAFNDNNFLVVEAGTGTGKSLAYLVPAIKWAFHNYGPPGRVIISTNTKNLQEQLFFKDLPILHSILKERFKAVLLKGKGNYLCLDKWVTVMNDMQYRLNPYERIKMLPLYFWAQHTETGDISENSGFRVERNAGLWTKFIAENNYCPGKVCKYYDRCFLMKARNNARDAHIVLVNHSLLFSDLAADNAVLSEYANVIFDEAHNVEKTATEYLGVEITLWQFRDFFNKLYMKEKIATGVLVQLKRRIQSGKLKQSHLDSLTRMIEDLIGVIPTSWRFIQSFFHDMTRLLSQKVPASESQYSTRHRYLKENDIFDRLKNQYNDIFKSIKKIQSKLNDLVEYFPQIPENSFEYQRQLFQDLNAQLNQLDLLMNNLEFLFAAEWDNFVYWFELPRREDSDDTRLYAAPLEVGGILNERLYSKLQTAIFTSATLAVDQKFDYFKKRVGIEYVPPGRVETLLLDSSFNYAEQVFMGIPTFLPDPTHPRFNGDVKELIEAMATQMPRGTLVLFTSYSMLNNIYQAVRQTFEAENIRLLGQGIDGGRHVIINQFKKQEKSFLLGTDSFWEGVDVPGKALELVLITKLPFDVPSEPIIQARSELIKRQGGNSFMEYSIPEAVIRFRQGFGRLIRSRSDYGAGIVLDTRVVKKRYGLIFLHSLPVQPAILDNEEEFWSRLKKWFR
jgi:predicted DnaQ family exonuclease/DinG family helicase